MKYDGTDQEGISMRKEVTWEGFSFRLNVGES